MNKRNNSFDWAANIFPEADLAEKVNHIRLFIQTTFFAILEIGLITILLPLIFETDDDALMNSIVSGAASGTPSEFILFTNVLIGKILKSLYLCCSSVNWYTWHYVVVFFLGYTSIQYSFAKIKGESWEKIIRHLFILSLVFFSLVIMQFTRISAMGIIGGMSLILLNKKPKPLELILAIVLIVWGALIRHHVLIMFAYLTLPAIFYLILRKRLKALSVITVSFILAIGLNNYHKSVYDKHPEIKKYKQFVSIAASLYTHNNPESKFKDNSAITKKVGWNKADQNLAAQSNIDVGHPKFSRKKLTEILKNKRTTKEKVNEGFFIPSLIQVTKLLGKYLSQTYMLAFYLLLILLFINFSTKQKVTLLLAFGYAFAMAFGLFFVKNGIPKDRVLFGLITPLFLWAIAQSKPKTLSKNLIIASKFLPSKFIKNALISLAIFSVILPIAAYGRQIPKINMQIITAQNTYQTIVKQKDELAAIWIDIRSYPLFDQPYSLENLYRLGWSAGSPSNKRKIEKYSGEKGSGIYSIFNKDIKWYFNPHYYHKFAQNIENFYLTNYENCRFNKDTLYTEHQDTVFRLTFFIPKNDGNGNDTIQ